MKPKHNYISIFLILMLILTWESCGLGDQDTKENEIDTNISASIAIPVEVDHVIDTANVAKISFEYTTTSFDTIPQGTIVTKTYPFQNTGLRPLIISDVTTSCGCTAVEIPEGIIEPGQSSSITVEFDSSDRKGYQNKTINIIGNTFPTRTLLYLQGFVN
ncbi:hypothetical protein GCM10025777_10140 [Membranihabitans marinus]